MELELPTSFKKKTLRNEPEDNLFLKEVSVVLFEVSEQK